MTDTKPISIKGCPYKTCPICLEQVKYLYHSKPHMFTTLNGVMSTYICYYGCRNGHIFYNDNPYVFPYKGFGKDVYAKIVHLRYKKRMTLAEVREEIERKYGITMDKETLRSIVRFYQILSHDLIPEEKIAEMRENGGIVLSIDAIGLDDDSDHLYAVRDVLTDTVLVADFIETASEGVLIALLNPLKAKLEELELPVLGTISDKLRSQEKAVEHVFPDAPKQLCIYHFFKAGADSAVKWDKNLATQLRKGVRRNHYVKELKKKALL